MIGRMKIDDLTRGIAIVEPPVRCSLGMKHDLH